jgi:ATP-binding cassette subfamily C (CFTR/MRP) protein 10
MELPPFLPSGATHLAVSYDGTLTIARPWCLLLLDLSGLLWASGALRRPHGAAQQRSLLTSLFIGATGGSLCAIAGAAVFVASERMGPGLYGYEALHSLVSLAAAIFGVLGGGSGRVRMGEKAWGSAAACFLAAVLLCHSVAVRWGASCADGGRLAGDAVAAAGAVLLATALLGAGVGRYYANSRRPPASDAYAAEEERQALISGSAEDEEDAEAEEGVSGRGSLNPHDSSSFLSWLSFSFLAPYFDIVLGSRDGPIPTEADGVKLSMEAIHPLPCADETGAWAARFAQALDAVMREHEDGGQDRAAPSPPAAAAKVDGGADAALPPPPLGKFSRPLLVAILRVFGPQWAMLGIGQAACVALALAGPPVLARLLAYLEAPTGSVDASPWAGLGWATAMAATQGGAALATTQFCFWTLRVQIRLRAALLAAVARAVHEAPLATRCRLSDGRLSNFVSVDVQKLQDCVSSFHQLWTLPIQVGVVLALLHGQVNYGWGAGLAVLIVVIPANLAVSRAIGRLTGVMMTARDERVRLTGEMLSGMKSVKMLSWEGPVAALIGKARAREVAALASRKYLDAVCVFLWATTPVLMSLATFAAVVLLFPSSSSALTPSVVFATVAELQLLTFPLNALPWIYTGVLEAWVSLGRLEAVLCYPREGALAEGAEQKDAASEWVVSLGGEWVHPTDSDGMGSRGHTRGFRLSLTPSPALSLPVPPITRGQLVLVLGRVGAGKSSLISALIGNMSPAIGGTHGSRILAPWATVAYAPQSPWVRRGSVAANVACGSEVDLARLSRVLAAVALTEEVAALAGGVEGEVSSTVLSGGQSQRLGLARALFTPHTDVLLLDDPVSALDTVVGRTVWKRAVGLGAAHLAHRPGGRTWVDFEAGACAFAQVGPSPPTRIVVTHDHAAIALCRPDLIIGLVEGRIAYAGPPVGLLGDAAMQAALGLPASIAGNEAALSPPRVVSPVVAPPASAVAVHEHAKVFLGGKPAEEEARAAGTIKGAVVRSYVSAVGTLLVVFVLASLFAMQASRNGSDLWLSVWASVRAATGSGSEPAGTGPSAALARLVSAWPDLRLLAVYAGIVGFNTVAALLRSASFAVAGVAACVTLHDAFLTALVRVPMAFHDATPPGRIGNRASVDVFAIDESLPFSLNILLAQSFGLAGALAVLTYSSSGLLLLAAPPLVLAYFGLQGRYRAVSRELKRLDSVTRSPLFEELRGSLAGAAVLRAASLARGPRWGGVEDATALHGHQQPTSAAADMDYDAVLGRLDATQRTSFASGALSQWLALRLGALSCSLLGLVSAGAVMARVLSDAGGAGTGDDGGCTAPAGGPGSASASYAGIAGMAGLALAYATPIVAGLQSLVGAVTDTERELVGVERVAEYAALPPEEDYGRGVDGKEEAPLPRGWVPPHGRVTFKHVTVRYSSYYGGGTSTGNPALRDLSLDVPAGTVVGILGRTGSGKSTLLSALARLVPCDDGVEGEEACMEVDGVDTRRIHLRDLRRSIAFLPQSPLLFSKDVRFNLDPTGEHDDAALLAACATCGLLPSRLGPAGLDTPVEEGGRNFSLGERQLLCLARALLRGASIVCMDEASSSMDAGTDAALRSALRTAFGGRTVFIIAHRLDTLADCDAVLVLDGGRVAQYGPPASLLAGAGRTMGGGGLRAVFNSQAE